MEKKTDFSKKTEGFRKQIEEKIDVAIDYCVLPCVLPFQTEESNGAK
jgi:hypothetical protein